MFDIREVDWNKAWKDGRGARTGPARDERFWNERAPEFAKAAGETKFAEEFLTIMEPRMHWRVLDMGCGSGTLAIPLAKQVNNVTAVDFSPQMLAILKGRCKELGIGNIKAVQGRWEDDWEAMGIGMHDVAIASRSLVSDDLRGALLKLDAIVRERVYIVATVGDGPYDRRMFETIGRTFRYRPDYIYLYNLLYQMGIFAEVNFICTVHDKAYASPSAAFDSVLWMFDRLSAEEEKLLRVYLTKNLVCLDGKWSLSYRHVTRWAVIWWTKENIRP